MEAAFSEAGLGGYQVTGTQDSNTRNQQAAYVAALAEGKALPMNWNDYLVQALDSGNVFSDSKEREERLHIAKQQELSLVLRNLPGVQNATVHYDRQKKAAFGKQSAATASV